MATTMNQLKGAMTLVLCLATERTVLRTWMSSRPVEQFPPPLNLRVLRVFDLQPRCAAPVGLVHNSITKRHPSLELYANVLETLPRGANLTRHLAQFHN
jgi:hypothetical protein